MCYPLGGYGGYSKGGKNCYKKFSSNDKYTFFGIYLKFAVLNKNH